MFSLTIPITQQTLSLLKSELLLALPHVKSSHRCEALARGLGFRTYAAARHAAVESGSTIPVQGDLFQRYLADHGFQSSAVPFYRAAARIALAELRETTPLLTVWGMGVGRPRRKADGKLETSVEMNQKFVEARNELTSDGTVEAFLLTLALLSRIPPTKTVRQGSGSYWLKHIAENFAASYPTGEKLGPRYVPNGAAIAAALHAGFRSKSYVDEYGYVEINVSFNMSKSMLIDLDCEMRPTGAHAEDRRWRERERERRQRYRSYFRKLAA